MDIRLQQLSYSSRLTLHSCPRKYQLYKLKSVRDEDEDESQSVTFAFGHVVGLGIQNCFENLTENQIYFNAFLMWEPDLLAENVKQVKSFWLALHAINKFIAMRKSGFLKDWSLVSINGKKATELSFIINFPDGFTYKGFVDVVLQNDLTGEIMVVEVKTTAQNYVPAATYKNSAQAIGYSIVLDVPFPKLSGYTVKYVVYKTKTMEYEVMDFQKDYLSRALWIREILLDIEMIKLYENANIYPMHGESCNAFFRECEYLSICTLSTDKLTDALKTDDVIKIMDMNKGDFEINLSLNDLIMSQLDKEMIS